MLMYDLDMSKSVNHKKLSIFVLNSQLFLWIVVAVSIVLFAATSIVNDRYYREQIAGMRFSAAVDAYAQQKRDFCYNRSIKPCNDDTLYEWNKAHPDDSFAFKSNDEIGKLSGV